MFVKIILLADETWMNKTSLKNLYLSFKINQKNAICEVINCKLDELNYASLLPNLTDSRGVSKWRDSKLLS